MFIINGKRTSERHYNFELKCWSHYDKNGELTAQSAVDQVAVDVAVSGVHGVLLGVLVLALSHVHDSHLHGDLALVDEAGRVGDVARHSSRRLLPGHAVSVELVACHQVRVESDVGCGARCAGRGRHLHAAGPGRAARRDVAGVELMIASLLEHLVCRRGWRHSRVRTGGWCQVHGWRGSHVGAVSRRDHV